MMNAKFIGLVIGVIVVLSALTVARTQPVSPDLPPGISENDWVAISDDVGIVVTAMRSEPAGTIFLLPSQRGAVPVISTTYASGRLMARVGGIWVEFEALTAAEPRFRHLQ